MSGLTACLWFDGQAGEAARFYVSVLRDGTIGGGVTYNDEGAEVSGKPSGSTMLVPFEVEGQRFLALNGGPQFTFNESISFIVTRDTQNEIDEVWNALISGGGSEGQCGWLKDRFGVSWQVIPSMLPALMGNGDPESAARASKALFGMQRIVIAELERARDGVA